MKLFHPLKDIKAGSIVILDPGFPAICRIASLTEDGVGAMGEKGIKIVVDMCYSPGRDGEDLATGGEVSDVLDPEHPVLLIREPS